ncbi:MarR family winged helix-turn-helix transcriptional regulator [Ensifer sp. LCM 4579]|uniref:MarR family winged helix-turn-helix transcriptional regulator n=1 Tax=Ensifer sp. LCM 4579 TaxID=1848292 RepID=UPI0008D92404|nr:MarR family transcriptional regulator [Ensifer sp. LCM 4579]OHV80889.1 MarR family transcriptional regulator [Ensifer sp. LCM 4579]
MNTSDARLLPSDVERLGLLLHTIPRLMRKRFERWGNEHGLSVAQWRLLAWTLREDGATQARLAELLEIEPISVSRLIDRMEEGGWVERRQGVEDRRVRRVFATPKARDAHKGIKRQVSQIYEEALAGLDQNQRAMLIGALERMSENLSDDDEAHLRTMR